jgi:hypothetical protein
VVYHHNNINNNSSALAEKGKGMKIKLLGRWGSNAAKARFPGDGNITWLNPLLRTLVSSETMLLTSRVSHGHFFNKSTEVYEQN